MSWAAGSWHLVEARAAVLGVTGRPGGPVSLLDCDSRFLLAFIEGVLRESPEHDKALTKMYAAAQPVRATPQSRDARNREIQKLSRLFG